MSDQSVTLRKAYIQPRALETSYGNKFWFMQIIFHWNGPYSMIVLFFYGIVASFV